MAVMLPVKPQNYDPGCLEDLDCVPFKVRLKLLKLRNQTRTHSDSTTCELYREWRTNSWTGLPGKKEEAQIKAEGVAIRSPASCPRNFEDHLMLLGQYQYSTAAVNQSSSGACHEDASVTSCICSTKLPIVDSWNDLERRKQLNMAAGTLKCSTCSIVPVKVKVESCHDRTTISSQDSVRSFDCRYEEGAQVKDETSDKFDNNLDCIVLRERRKMLLSRMVKQSPKLLSECYSGELSNISSEGAVQQSIVRGIRQCKAVQQECLVDGQSYIRGDAYNICPALVSSKNEIARASFTMSQCLPSLSYECQAADSAESRSSPTLALCKSEGCQDALTSRVGTVEAPTLSPPVRVKVEPLDTSEPQIQEKSIWDKFCIEKTFTVKSELRFLEETLADELDHLPLIERMRLLPSGTPSCLNTSPKLKPLDLAVEVVDSVKPIRVSCPRKRKRTATNSAETALVEDAPELLKVLIEKGISVEEIKLYGGIDSDDPLDDSQSEDSFDDLEAVISKLFPHHQPLLKFPPIRCAKVSKASYCLACLLTLIEQAQYLRTRSWPVEWGWCRDLQSFVFVFPKHNRIVLERPEYGYATYFFEILISLPIDWQIRRLVTTMKLTISGRLTLIENKALVVGEDLSEGEARVLAEYGWIPNTGLGTMLNYRARVCHDKKDVDPCEWKSKIGKMLMDGVNGGNLVCSDVPKKLLDYQCHRRSPQVKLESEGIPECTIPDYRHCQSPQVKLEFEGIPEFTIPRP
ncbi:hypothetical protein Dimus_033196 [Dionaea muscipula]